MSEESLTLYKLMILFMLDNLDFPLTNSQLSEFFVNHGYTSYFHLQQAISELVESEFVRTETIRNTTNYHLMESGKEALSMFHTQISEPIKKDILDYFAEKKYQLRKEVEMCIRDRPGTSYFFKNSSNVISLRKLLASFAHSRTISAFGHGCTDSISSIQIP